MSSLNQFAWIAGTTIYRFGHNSIPNIPIVDAPPDADLSNWAMLHDGSAYRLYAFKRGTTDTLYQAAFNGSAYQFGFNSIPVLRLVGFPPDADASSFAMLHDGSAYRLYLRRSGDPRTLYQASWVAGTDTYQFGHNSIPAISIVNFPDDTDWQRWMMLHDGSAYRLYAFKAGGDREFYQGSFDGAAYRFAFNSIPMLTLEGTPADSNTSHASMLHDGADYRFYFQTSAAPQPQPEPPTQPPEPEPPIVEPPQPEPQPEPPVPPPSRRWTFVQGLDSDGGDIGNFGGGKPSDEMIALADATPGCIAFNTNGWYKNVVSPREQWVRWSDNPNEGMWVLELGDTSEPPVEPPAPPSEPPPRTPVEFSERGAIVTPILNVSDIGASIRWLEALGWTRRNVYNANGLVADVHADADVATALFATLRFGYGQIFLSLNAQGLRGGLPVGPGSGEDAGATWMYWYMSSPAEVDELFARATAAGVTIVAAPEAKPWGEHELRIAHPDGHVFRIAATIIAPAPAPEPVPEPAPTPAPEPEAKVTVFEHNDYQGRSQELVVGYNAGPLAVGNDVVSSVRVPRGLRVTLYEHGPGTGRELVLTEDTASLPDFNDVTSNILVERIEG